MHVTVFGGASAQPGDPGYTDAFNLGSLLAQAGHTVLTGGYMGTMEAASKGAALSGGHVIGVTCAEIERWRNARANPWIKEEWRTDTLIERLTLLMDRSQAAIALAGGPGTLVEIALLWNRMIIEAVPLRPLILVGKGWKNTMDTLFLEQDSCIALPQRRLLTFRQTVEEAAAFIQNN